MMKHRIVGCMIALLTVLSLPGYAFQEKPYQSVSEVTNRPAHKKEQDTLLNKQETRTSGISTKNILLVIALLLAAVARWQLSTIEISRSTSKQKRSNLYADIYSWSVVILFGFVFLWVTISLFSGDFTDMLSWILHSFPLVICVAIVLYFFLAHLNILSALRMSHRDDINYFEAVFKFYRQSWWHALISPLLLLIIILQLVQSRGLKKRTSMVLDKNAKPMRRIDRDAADVNQYLSAGELKEEDTGSLVYDIWTSDDAEYTKLVPHPGYHYQDFGVCPACGFRTYTQPVAVSIKEATYTRDGKAKRVNLCLHCKHEHFIEFIILYKLVQINTST